MYDTNHNNKQFMHKHYIIYISWPTSMLRRLTTASATGMAMVVSGTLRSLNHSMPSLVSDVNKLGCVASTSADVSRLNARS